MTRGIVTKITKISTPRKLPAIRYTALHSSYHIGEPNLILKLLLTCVYDTMIMY